MSHVGSGGDISDSASDEDDEFGALLLMVTCVLVDVERIPCRTSILTGLLVLCQGVGQRTCAERFQHSMRTIHLCVKHVVRALARLGNEVIRSVNRGPFNQKF
ncbi:unnamed protein product [Cuscuta europaea]|nr:unnamed protein product [Cuscuta europaea]